MSADVPMLSLPVLDGWPPPGYVIFEDHPTAEQIEQVEREGRRIIVVLLPLPPNPTLKQVLRVRDQWLDEWLNRQTRVLIARAPIPVSARMVVYLVPAEVGVDQARERFMECVKDPGRSLGVLPIFGDMTVNLMLPDPPEPEGT